MAKALNFNFMMTRSILFCKEEFFALKEMISNFRVLYFSMHRYDYGRFWPNLRQSDFDYIGEGAGKGYNINIPLNQVIY